MLKQIKENIKLRLHYANYTLQHKKAFLKCQNELITQSNIKSYNLLRGYIHDIEKPLFYILFGLNFTKWFHAKFARHHNPKSRGDLLESIIDFECARYTKPDKPLPAREFIYKKKKDMISLYEPLLQELGL